MEKVFKYTVKYLMVPLIVVLTLFGSTMGLIVLNSRRLKLIGPVSIYRYLMVFEYFSLMIIVEYMIDAFELDLSLLSSSICKLYWFVSYTYGPLPAMLLVYISFERFVSVTYPTKRLLLRKQSYQHFYFLIVLGYNSVVYLFLLFSVDVRWEAFPNATNQTDGFMYCGFKDLHNVNALDYIDFLNRLALPFLLMLFCTTQLIMRLFQQRLKFKSRRARSVIRDVRFSLSCIMLNTVYLLLNLPFSIYVLLPYEMVNVTVSSFFQYLLHLNFGLEFFIIVLSNSLVRAEFVRLVRRIFIFHQG